MSSKLKLSLSASEQLDFLSKKLNLRRNTICRLAIGRSLKKKDRIKDIKFDDSLGYEFNRYTLTGEHDLIFKALVAQCEQSQVTDSEFFTKHLRNHIERGVAIMHGEYRITNSPSSFLIGLANNNDEAATEKGRQLVGVPTPPTHK